VLTLAGFEVDICYGACTVGSCCLRLPLRRDAHARRASGEVGTGSVLAYSTFIMHRPVKRSLL